MPEKGPTRTAIFANYMALVALLIISVAAASAPLGAWKPAIALFIAAVKTALIFLIFMRLRYQSGLVRIFALGGFFWLAIISTLTLADYLTRAWL